MTKLSLTRHRRGKVLLAGMAAAALAVTGCSNSGTDSTVTPAASDAGQQTVKSAEPSGSASVDPAADGCTLETYGNGGVEKIDLKDAIVGFSQSEPDAAAFRAAETQSIRDEAAKIGVKNLLVTNANAELPKQISDIQSMLNQGAQFLIVAPVNSDGLDPALTAAREKGVPVLTIDRKVTNTACTDYLTFIGSDFLDQGKRAAQEMAKATDGKANVAILLGSSGNNVTDQRTKGFVDEVAASSPDLKIVAQQTGNFAREEGQSVTEQLLQSNPEIDAIYAENDEMALGAVTAITAAGKKPGTDIKVVSIDGTKNAVQGVVDGQINAVVESNPRFGPLAFQTAMDFYAGQAIPEDIIISDDLYTPADAEAKLGNAF